MKIFPLSPRTVRLLVNLSLAVDGFFLIFILMLVLFSWKIKFDLLLFSISGMLVIRFLMYRLDLLKSRRMNQLLDVGVILLTYFGMKSVWLSNFNIAMLVIINLIYLQLDSSK